MPAIITVRLPSLRRVIAGVAAATAFAVLLVVGVAIGSRLVAADPLAVLSAASDIEQVRVLSGTVYVGHVVASGGGYVRLADAAVIRQGDASSEPRLVIESLRGAPYDTAGYLIIPVTSVEWVTAVLPGSGLEAAYQRAIGAVPGTPAPSGEP